ncbi:MAG: four helix bundle protein [Planctomycetes bacterium]|nr:four helix bundle protein [Planctomycetota bacterium]
MSKEISERLYKFALSIVKLVRTLPSELSAREIGKQLIRSGTSVAANYEEAIAGFSKDDFTYKLSTSFKEAKETNLWLRLLRDSGIVGPNIVEDVTNESVEITNILGKSVKTAKQNK